MKFNVIISIIFTLFLSSSCSNYINKIHKDLDQAEIEKGRERDRGKDKFAHFKRGYYNQSAFERPNRQFAPISTQNQAIMNPKVQRQYRPSHRVKKRYTASDLNDNSSSNSLWAGNQTKELFLKDREKQNGDIILINVLKKLKNDITLELKRAFPTVKKPKVDKDGKPIAATANNAAEEAEENKTEVYDRVSSVVVEEVNENHLLLRGQKSLLYKNRKRLVEIQALVSRRDILDNDTINSDALIETDISILR